jgi:hypothetical protein
MVLCVILFYYHRTADIATGPVSGVPGVPRGTVAFKTAAMVLNVGESERLEWTFTPPAAGDAGVRLSSSNHAVATIDDNGTVKALSGGMTLISVEGPGGESARIPLRVKDPSIPLPG